VDGLYSDDPPPRAKPETRTLTTVPTSTRRNGLAQRQRVSWERAEWRANCEPRRPWRPERRRRIMGNGSLDGILDRVFAEGASRETLCFVRMARTFRSGSGGSGSTARRKGRVATGSWGGPRGVGREKFAPRWSDGVEGTVGKGRLWVGLCRTVRRCSWWAISPRRRTRLVSCLHRKGMLLCGEHAVHGTCTPGQHRDYPLEYG